MAVLTSQLVVELLDRVTAPARQVSKSLFGISSTIKDANNQRIGFGDRLDAAISRNNRALANARLGLADAVAGFYTLRAAIASPVEEATRFESAMADVRKVVDFPTPQAFRDFQAGLMALSRDIPLTVNGLAEIAAAAGQAGIAGDDLVRFTDAAARIGVAFDISADEAGSAMAKMMTGLGLSIGDLTLSLIVWRRFKRPMPGLVEVILDLNQDLADLGPILPIGTVFEMPVPVPRERTLLDPIRLW